MDELLLNIKAKSVLDIGCGGLDGENTTNCLVKRFGASRILGVCKDKESADRYMKSCPEISIETRLFDPKNYGTFDLVVNDLGIEGNLYYWEHMEEIVPLLNKGGHYITYVMCTDKYGDAETPKQIREHWARYYSGYEPNEVLVWDLLRVNAPQFKRVDIITEERRPEIVWVLLKYE